METLTSDIWNNIISSIDFSYILLCNLITFLIINTINNYYKIFKLKLKRFGKKLIAFIVAIILGFICVLIFKHNPEFIFYGFFLQFFSYDYIWKYIIKKLQSYKKNTN